MDSKKNLFYSFYGSKVDRVNIRLRNFKFFHQATNEESEDPKFFGRENIIQQLTNWLEECSGNGAYLVTGTRGVGKSSFVGKVLNDLEKQKDKSLIIRINMGHEMVRENELLHLITKILLEKYTNYVNQRCLRFKHYLFSVFSTLFLFSLLYIFVVLFNSAMYGYYSNGNASAGTSILRFLKHCFLLFKDMTFANVYGHFPPNVSLLCLFLGGIFLLFLSWRFSEKLAVFLNKKSWFSLYNYKVALQRLQVLNERLNASITYQLSVVATIVDKLFQWNPLHKKEQNRSAATLQEIETELIEILNIIKKDSYYNPNIIVVFDELDKTETEQMERELCEKESLDMNLPPDFEKSAVYSKKATSSRNRKYFLMNLIANMKFFLTSAKAHFIFIAGEELYEAFQADVSDRDFSISSIFSGVIHVDSFLTSSRAFNNTVLMAERFICQQLMENTDASTNKSKDADRYTFKSYYQYLQKNADYKSKSVEIWNIYWLYRFAHYMAYVSNGSPKKMCLFFEKNVRSYNYLKQYKYKDIGGEELDKVLGKLNENENGDNIYFLSLGYYVQEKVGFVHYLTYPLIHAVINKSNAYGDKLLVQASFLINELFKYHNCGFSWRNLELMPELQMKDKTSELRDFISSIITFEERTHITTISCGLYHYKFPMKMAEEISYCSKISSEMSALFNFSPQQTDLIKKYYSNLLHYYSDTSPVNVYTPASIHHVLGDVYMLEENYTLAIHEYELACQMVHNLAKPMKNTLLQYAIFYLRTMLKLGLAHEKRRTDNSAYCVYIELLEYIERLSSLQPEFVKSQRVIYLPVLSHLYVLDKINVEGIQLSHIKEALEKAKKLHTSENPILYADFYRKLATVLYYKLRRFDLKEIKSDPNKFLTKSYSVIEQCVHQKHRNYASYLCLSCQAYRKSIVILLEEMGATHVDKLYTSFVTLRFCVMGNLSHRSDQKLVELAEAVEGRGHTLFSCADEKDVISNDFLDNFLDLIKFRRDSYFSGASIARIKDLINVMNQRHSNSLRYVHLEKVIIYYWCAAVFYNSTNNRTSSVRCLKQILCVLTCYVQQNEIERAKCIADHIEDISSCIVNHSLMILYWHYEHVNITETQQLKWIYEKEMFQQIDLNQLSHLPDIAEVLYNYFKLHLLCKGMDKEVIHFYQSNMLSKKLMFCTLTSKIYGLNFKSICNQKILENLLDFSSNVKSEVQQTPIEFYHYLMNAHKNLANEKDIFPQSISISDVSNVDTYFDLLEFLIADSMFCLTTIIEQISPLRNTTLFTNSFLADIYMRMQLFNMYYELLYSLYYYGNKTDANSRKEIVAYLMSLGNRQHSGFNPDIMEIRFKDYLNNLTSTYSIGDRLDHFRDQIKDVTRSSNVNLTNHTYLAEKAIAHYTKAREICSGGKSYKEMMANLHFLDDDLCNDTCQFLLAEERYMLNCGLIEERLRLLKKQNWDSTLYDYSKY